MYIIVILYFIYYIQVNPYIFPHKIFIIIHINRICIAKRYYLITSSQAIYPANVETCQVLHTSPPNSFPLRPPPHTEKKKKSKI